MFRNFKDGSEVVTVPSVDVENVKQLPVHRAEFLDLLVDVVKKRNVARLHTNRRLKKLTVGCRPGNPSLSADGKQGTRGRTSHRL
jgi:hypothetical protein